jgi:hypothetical protein
MNTFDSRPGTDDVDTGLKRSGYEYEEMRRRAETRQWLSANALETLRQAWCGDRHHYAAAAEAMSPIASGK